MAEKVDEEGNVKTDITGEVRPFGMADKVGYLFGDFGNEGWGFSLWGRRAIRS